LGRYIHTFVFHRQVKRISFEQADVTGVKPVIFLSSQLQVLPGCLEHFVYHIYSGNPSRLPRKIGELQQFHSTAHAYIKHFGVVYQVLCRNGAAAPIIHLLHNYRNAQPGKAPDGACGAAKADIGG